MYFAEIVNQWRGRAPDAAKGPPLPATVYALGATSLLTDISTEMVASILPVYLMVALHLSPSAYGLMDGLFRGGAGVAAVLLGAMLSYHSGRSKLIAGLGYAASLLSRLVLLLSGAFGVLAAGLVLDRLGKGLRVAPRDAMLAASVPASQLGLAFGMHRAMDGVGAMAGPLLASLLLWLVPDGYRAVFGAALAASVCGLLVFGRWAQAPARRTAPHVQPGLPAGARWRSHLAASLPAPCRKLLGLAMLLTLFTVSEGMIYAHMQQSFALEPYMQPLLPVAAATCFLMLAVPMGWLADRLGAVRVFCAAHGLLLPLYGLLFAAGAPSWWQAGAVVLLLGCFTAATDGVLMAALSAAVPSSSRSLSLGLAAAGLALMKLLSSALFGYLWDRIDLPYAVLVYGAGLLLSLAVFLWARPFRGVARAPAV
jgi:MFS family permease